MFFSSGLVTDQSCCSSKENCSPLSQQFIWLNFSAKIRSYWSKKVSRWWFKIFFISSPYLGFRFPILMFADFSNQLVQPPTIVVLPSRVLTNFKIILRVPRSDRTSEFCCGASCVAMGVARKTFANNENPEVELQNKRYSKRLVGSWRGWILLPWTLMIYVGSTPNKLKVFGGISCNNKPGDDWQTWWGRSKICHYRLDLPPHTLTVTFFGWLLLFCREFST